MTQPFEAFLSAPTTQALFSLSPFIVLVLAGFFTVFGIIMAFIFEYHWKTYGVDKIQMLRVRFWFYIGTAIFGGGMLLFALLYAFNS